MSDKTREALHETAIKHLEAYNSPNAWNADAIWALRDPSCEHYLEPRESLEPQFRGNINEEAHRHFMTFFGPIFDNFQLKVKWEAIDTQRRVVVHALDATMDLKAFGDGPAVNGYKAHYMWTLWLNEDAKIIKLEETIDIERIMGDISKRAARYAEWQKGQEAQ